MKETAVKIARFFLTVCLFLVVVSLFSYLIQSDLFGFKSKQASPVESKPQTSENFGTDNDGFDYSPQTPPNEGDDVYSQRQLRANENDKLQSDGKEYRLWGQLVTTDEGVSISSVFNGLGEQVTEHYGYGQYYPSPKSTGKYVEAVLNLENMTKNPIVLNMHDVHLVDEQNRTFTPIKKDGSCGLQNRGVPTTIGELAENPYSKEVDEINGNLNPNVPCAVRVLFEIASSSSRLYLVFTSN